VAEFASSGERQGSNGGGYGSTRQLQLMAESQSAQGWLVNKWLANPKAASAAFA
jgi:hypothetical protein